MSLMYRDGNDAIDKKIMSYQDRGNVHLGMEIWSSERHKGWGEGSGTLLCPEVDCFIKEELAKDKSSKVTD